MNRFPLAAAAVAALVSLSALAQAPAPTPQPAKLTMAQAVVIAEFMGQGRALKAKLDERAGMPVYRVTLKDTGKEPLKVTLAAYGGEVVASERERGRD